MNLVRLSVPFLMLFMIFVTISNNVVAQEQTPIVVNAEIPSVIGFDLPQATAILRQAGYDLGVVTVSAWTPEAGRVNTISAQFPPAGTPEDIITVDTVKTVDVTVLRQPNVLLLYDDNDLTLKNEALSAIYIDNVIFSAVDGTGGQVFSLASWGELGDVLLEGACLQIWSELRNGPKAVDECATIRFWASFVNPDVHFWTGAENATQFHIIQDGVERGICQIMDGRCELYLPTGTIAEDVVEYLYFMYTPEVFMLINRSENRWLPLDTVRIRDSASHFENHAGVLLAPGECAVIYAADAPEPDCVAVVSRTTSQAFWRDGFEVNGAFENRIRACLPPASDIQTLCILQR